MPAPWRPSGRSSSPPSLLLRLLMPVVVVRQPGPPSTKTIAEPWDDDDGGAGSSFIHSPFCCFFFSSSFRPSAFSSFPVRWSHFRPTEMPRLFACLLAPLFASASAIAQVARTTTTTLNLRGAKTQMGRSGDDDEEMATMFQTKTTVMAPKKKFGVSHCRTYGARSGAQSIPAPCSSSLLSRS